MATHYDDTPTLLERIRGARLIAVGEVEAVEPMKRERLGELEEQQATASVVLKDVLKGASKQLNVNVRFIVPEPKSSRAVVHPLAAGQRVLLMLVPDVGREVGPNTYIAYFRAHYALTAGDTFKVAGGPRGKKDTAVTLKKLRELIKADAAAADSERQLWAKHEPQLLAEKRVATVTEIPHFERAGVPRSVALKPAVPKSRPKRKRK
jgi:hypothetical protein